MTIWPAQPCFNNLVTFDPVEPLETFDTVVPELAEKWSWQDGYRNLVFFLRKTVKWHDGQPFTSKDVKFTFDMVREAPDAFRLKNLIPRHNVYNYGACRRCGLTARSSKGASTAPSEPPPEIGCAGEAGARTTDTPTGFWRANLLRWRPRIWTSCYR